MPISEQQLKAMWDAIPVNKPVSSPATASPSSIPLDQLKALWDSLPEPPRPEEPGVTMAAIKGITSGTQMLVGGLASGVRWGGEAVGSKTIAEAGHVGEDFWQKRMAEGWSNPQYKGTFWENPSANRATYLVANAIPFLGLSVLTGGAAASAGLPMATASVVGATTSAFLENSPTFGEALDSGKTVAEASAIAGISTAGTALLEALPTYRFVRGLSGKLGSRIVKGMAAEVPTEAFQQVFQNAVKKIGFNPAQDLFEGVVESIVGAAGAGAVGGAVFKEHGKLQRAVANARNAGLTEKEINDVVTAVSEDVASTAEKKMKDVSPEARTVADVNALMAESNAKLAEQEQVPPAEPIPEAAPATTPVAPPTATTAGVAPGTLDAIKRVEESSYRTKDGANGATVAILQNNLKKTHVAEKQKDGTYRVVPKPATGQTPIPVKPDSVEEVQRLLGFAQQHQNNIARSEAAGRSTSFDASELQKVMAKAEAMNARLPEAQRVVIAPPTAPVAGEAAPTPEVAPTAPQEPLAARVKAVKEANRAKGEPKSLVEWLKRQGGIQPGIYADEVKNSPADVRMMFKGSGTPFDQVEIAARDEGIIGPDEDLAPLIFGDRAAFLKRGILSDNLVKPGARNTEEEFATAADAEAGLAEYRAAEAKELLDYVSVPAEALSRIPDGEKFQGIVGENRSDVYTAEDVKGDFATTIKDGQEVTVPWGERVLIHKDDAERLNLELDQTALDALDTPAASRSKAVEQPSAAQKRAEEPVPPAEEPTTPEPALRERVEAKKKPALTLERPTLEKKPPETATLALKPRMVSRAEEAAQAPLAERVAAVKEKTSTRGTLTARWDEAKKNHPNEIVFIQVGDFYETFGEDAELASSILGEQLYKPKDPKGRKMFGVAVHSINDVGDDLYAKGKKGAVFIPADPGGETPQFSVATQKIRTGLVDPDPGNFLYHATNLDRANEIAESGSMRLHRPNEYTDQSVWPDGSTRKRAYFSKNIGIVANFSPEEGKPVVLRVKDYGKYGAKKESTGDWYSEKPISAKDIEVLGEDNRWRPLTQENVQYAMAGPKAVGANEEALLFAQSREQAGVAMENIRRNTGWFKGIDGVWRYEISDAGFSLTPAFEALKESPMMGKKDSIPLSEAINHPALFRAYPELADVKIFKRRPLFDFGRGQQGWFDEKTNEIGITPYATDVPGTLIHEIQHWIQNKEGFAQGGNLDSALDNADGERLYAYGVKTIEAIHKEIENAKMYIDRKKKNIGQIDRLSHEQRKELERLSRIGRHTGSIPAADIYNKVIDMGAKDIFEAIDWLNAVKRLDWDRGYVNRREGEIVKAYQDIAKLQHPDSVEELRSLIKKAGKVSFEAYSAIAGEIESRDVSHRRTMTDEERLATKPYESQGIAPGDAIVVFKSGDQSFTMSMSPGKTVTSNPFTVEQVRELWAGQKVGLSKDGNVWVVLKNGVGFTIRAVKSIDADAMALELGWGQAELKGDEVIVGATYSDRIELVRGLADQFTLSHESVHMLERLGLLHPIEVLKLRSAIRRMAEAGEFESVNKRDVGGAEDRANFLGRLMDGHIEPKGFLAKLKARIQEFVDRLGEMVHSFMAGREYGRAMREGATNEQATERALAVSNRYRTPGAIARDIVRGRVANRKGPGGALATTPEGFEIIKPGDVNTERFRRWFGESGVVDQDGKPLPVYHSGSFRTSEDERFVIEKDGGIHFGTEDAAKARIGGKTIDDAFQGIEVYESEDGSWGFEINGADYGDGYASEDEAQSAAEEMAESTQSDDSTYEDEGITEAYLSLQNPKTVKDQGANWEKAIALAKKEGYDGIIYVNQYEDKGTFSYIAFYPEQIKATNNRGTWDPTDPRISYAVRAKHGSPHAFARFSTDFIGTGEGAQAFGWGLYFSELEDVVRHYASIDTGRGTVISIDGEEFEDTNAGWQHEEGGTVEDEGSYEIALTAFRANSFNVKDAIDYINDDISAMEKFDETNTKEYEESKKAITMLKERDFKKKGNLRNIYNVTLHKGKKPGEYAWMDWDKPIGQDVVDRIKATDPNVLMENVHYEKYTGKELYRFLVEEAENEDKYSWGSDDNPKKAASLFLLRMGIDGIRYPAGSLSGMKIEAKNYVVFDPNAVTIEEHVQYAVAKKRTPEEQRLRDEQEKTQPPETRKANASMANPVTARQWLEDEGRAIIETVFSRGPAHGIKDLGRAQLYAGSPEFFKNEAARKLQQAGSNRFNRAAERINDWLGMASDSESVVEDAKALPPAEYKQYQDILVDADRRGMKIPETEKAIKEGAFGKVPDSVMKVWRNTRTMLDTMWDEMTAPLREMIEAEKESAAFEGRPVKDLKVRVQGEDVPLSLIMARMGNLRGSYFPRGRHRGEIKIVGKMPNGEGYMYVVPGVSAFVARIEANRLKTQLTRQGYTNLKVEQIPESIFGMFPKQNLMELQEILKNAAERTTAGRPSVGMVDADLVAQAKAEIIQSVAEEIMARGSRATRIRRQSEMVHGYFTDPVEALTRYVANQAYGMSKGEALKAMQDVFVNEIDMDKQPRLAKWAVAFINEQARTPDRYDRMIALGKSIASVKYLANLRSPLVNTTSLATSAQIAMRQYATDGKASFLEVGKETAMSSYDAARIMLATRGGKAGDLSFLSKDDHAMVRRVLESAYANPQFAREATGNLQDAYGKTWRAITKTGMWLFGVTEKFNRLTTILAAFRLAKTHGFSKDAYARAITSMERAHQIYDKSTDPYLAMGAHPAARLVKMGYTFGKYPHGYVQLLLELGFQKHDIQGVIFGIAAPVVIGGGMSVAGYNVIMAIAGAMMHAIGDDRDPEAWVWDTVRKWLGRDGEEVARYGLVSLAGLEIHSSLGIGSGLPTDLLGMTGAIGGVVTDIGRSIGYMRTRQYSKGAEQLLPSGLANLIRAERELDGITTKSGDLVFDPKTRLPYRPSTAQTIMRGLGYASSELSMVRQSKWESQKEANNWTKHRMRIYAQFRDYLVRRDPAQWARVRKELTEFNDRVVKENKARPGFAGLVGGLIGSDNLRGVAQRTFTPNNVEKFNMLQVVEEDVEEDDETDSEDVLQ